MEPSVTLVLALVMLLLLALALRGGRARGGHLPPGPPPLPLLGNLLQLPPPRSTQALLKLSQRYGPLFTVWLGRRRVLVLADAAAVREALLGQPEAFAGRGRLPTVESTFHGHGVVFAEGERWRQLRRFSLTVLRDLGMGRSSIENRIQEEAQILRQEMLRTRGEPFDPTFLLSCAVSNIICTIVFGRRFDYGDAEFLELLQLMRESFRLLSTPWAQLYDMTDTFLRFLPGLHRRIPRLLAKLRSFVARRVQHNARTLQPEHPRDFIDRFLLQMEKEKSNPDTAFTHEDLELTTLNLFFAGTETVSSTLRLAFLLLTRHPEVQEQVQEEIERVVGRVRAPALADRAHMPFTEATLHEVQRVADLLPASIPHRVTRDTHLRGYFIPEGTEVFPLLSSALQDPVAFPHPDTFDPGHFLDASGRFRKSDAFLPFSAGKRLCLGEGLARAELFLFLTTLLQQLRLQPLGDPAEVPVAPQESGFANVPPHYPLRVTPR